MDDYTEHEERSGYERDLKEAENAIVNAPNERARRQAQRRHVEAIRNYMQGVLVPSFEDAIKRIFSETFRVVLREQLEGQLLPLQTEVANLKTRLDQHLIDVDERFAARNELRAQQFTDLTKMIERLDKTAGRERRAIRADVRKLRREFEAFKDDSGTDRAGIHVLVEQIEERLGHIESRLRTARTPAEVEALVRRLVEVETRLGMRSSDGG